MKRNEVKSLNDIFLYYQIKLKKLIAEKPAGVSDKDFDWQVRRELCKNDLFYLCFYELGYKDLDFMHWELCNLVLEEAHEELYLLPREHLKSTILTIADTVRCILKNPNDTHLITNATLENAQSFLAEIKNNLLGGDLPLLFPEVLEDVTRTNRWAEMSINVHRQTKVKEPTVSVAGVGASFASRHYNRIIYDDLHNEKNTESRDQIDKIIKWFQQVQSLVLKNGFQRVIGTVWEYGDLYEWIEQNLPDYRVYTRKVKEEPGTPGVKGDMFIFPKKWNEARLQKLKNTQNPFIYSCQYFNERVAEEDQLFKKQYFKYENATTITSQPTQNYFLCVEPASDISKVLDQKTADSTAMIVCGVNDLRERRFVEIVRDKLTPQDQIDMIFDLVQKWHINIVGIETLAFQSYLEFNLKQEMQKRNVYFNILELRPRGRKKTNRIKVLEPLFRTGKIIFIDKFLYTSIYDKQEKDMVKELEIEFLTFPKAKFDDMSDCAAYFCDIDAWLNPKNNPVNKNVKNLKGLDPFSKEYEILEDELRIQYHGANAVITQNEKLCDPVTGY